MAGGSGGTQEASDALGPVLRWLARLPDPVHLHLLCAGTPGRLRAPRRAVAVRLAGCGADLPASAFLELVAAGALSVTVHDVHPGAGAAAADDVLRRAGRPERVLVVPPRDPPGARARPVRDAAGLGLPRRAALAPAAAVRPGGRRRAGTEPARLRDALAALGVPADRPADVPEEAPGNGRAGQGSASPGPGDACPGRGADRSVLVLGAPGCTACGVCVRGCPEDALRLVGTDDRPAAVVLRQDVAACTGCGGCAELCPTGALRLAPAPPWAAVVGAGVHDVARVLTRTCARCRAPFGGGEGGLCPVCAYRRAHPFGSSAPPARG
ncbi:NADH-quinone oxidoreductase subunit I [Cellulosimicrobium cellulans]|uniref:NADH-quinone oxidoreductase subunit I n=1 Tax=Cellulosimicrobium cellulans TaxID=1710 RepID=UPI00130DEC27|nr:4Fe-4S dicluster domain-containing protein [Cellulosimicrobium cellulans]